MALSETCLVLRFDFTRVRWGSFDGWGEIERYNRDEADLFYHSGTDGQGSYCNGAMIVRPQLSVDDLVRAWKDGENPSERKYATFKIYDRKNGINVETSCAPEFLSNYFQQSDLPWEISPAFFRPEVLHRFKADPEKYTLEDRTISCRNAWSLKTYDINEAGQVHTYVGYLADLPYEEQIYWQAFNDWSKAPISARAYQTDIVGDWHREYEPLSEMKHTLSMLDATPPSWWKPRGTALSDAVRYPATDSVKEWGDEVLALDQYLVEGFLLKQLRELAEAGGRPFEQKWGSLRVLQEVLVAKDRTEAEAKAIVVPMQKLHALRSEVRGHATTKKKKAESEARTVFGSLRAHFTQMVTDCEKSLNEILQCLQVELKRQGNTK
jgi:7,8-dihydro-6-hydroxymethylpterin-pyrophosphokinase